MRALAIICAIVFTTSAFAIDSKQVDDAIAKAKKYLYEQQHGDNWELIN